MRPTGPASIYVYASLILLALHLPTILAQDPASSSDPISNDLPTSHILERANTFLASGQGFDAVKLYSVALERDPKDYLTLYKRGTTYLSLGQSRKALDDFEEVLTVNGEFDQARLQIARIHLKNGDLDAASSATSTYLKAHPTDSSALTLRQTISQAKAHLIAAQTHVRRKKWDECIVSTGEGIKVSPSNLQLREWRAMCHLEKGEVEEANGDLMRAAALSPSTSTLSVRVALIQSVFLGQPSSQSLSSLKQCLHFDPDDKVCKPLLRQLKSLDKELGKTRNFIEGARWRDALKVLDPRGPGEKGLIGRIKEIIDTYQKPTSQIPEPILPVDPEFSKRSSLLTQILSWTCKSYVQTSQIRLAKPICEELLSRDPGNIDGLVGKGEGLLKEENYDEAVRVFSDAFEKGGRSDRDVLEKLQKAQKLLKRSKAKDYYKVIGVSKDADKATIKKAYRKATLKAHPDKGGSEQAMAAVNEAYEVLSNDELRARFDNGDDPNDTSNQGGGGNPFGFHGGSSQFQQFFQQGGGGGFGGGHPFSGGQFHFKFGG